MRLNMFLRIVLLVGGFGLLATACGDDGDSTTDPPADDSADGSGDDSSGDDGSGDDGVLDESDRSAELIGTWAITTFQLAGGVGEATPVGEPSITFADDGTITFDTGCNTGGGEYDTAFAYLDEEDDAGVIGQGITFGSLSRTEIGCEAELGDQDLAIPGAIRAAGLFRFVDGDLVLVRDGNLMIGATRQ